MINYQIDFIFITNKLIYICIIKLLKLNRMFIGAKKMRISALKMQNEHPYV